MNLVCRELEQHVSGSLDTEKLSSDPYDVWVVGLLKLTPLSLARLGTAIGADRRRDKIGADETLERGRIIDIGGSLLLNRLKDMAFTAGDNGM